MASLPAQAAAAATPAKTLQVQHPVLAPRPFSSTYCEAYRAGYCCSGNSEDLCTGNDFSGYASASCDAANPGYFAPDGGFAAEVQCPAGAYAFSGGAARCAICAGGSDCTGSSSSSCSPSAGALSAEGDPLCAAVPDGYEVPSGASSDSITFAACQFGEYRTSAGGTCEACPVSKECDASSASSCGTGTYSEAGWPGCASVPYGSE